MKKKFTKISKGKIDLSGYEDAIRDAIDKSMEPIIDELAPIIAELAGDVISYELEHALWDIKIHNSRAYFTMSLETGDPESELEFPLSKAFTEAFERFIEIEPPKKQMQILASELREISEALEKCIREVK